MKVKLGLGLLLSCGHPLETILDMTFPQIEASCEAILLVKVRTLDEILRPILAGLGEVEYKAPRLRGLPLVRGRKKALVRQNRSGGSDFAVYATGDPAKGEAALKGAFAALGFPVRVTHG